MLVQPLHPRARHPHRPHYFPHLVQAGQPLHPPFDESLMGDTAAVVGAAEFGAVDAGADRSSVIGRLELSWWAGEPVGSIAVEENHHLELMAERLVRCDWRFELAWLEVGSVQSAHIYIFFERTPTFRSEFILSLNYIA